MAIIILAGNKWSKIIVIRIIFCVKSSFLTQYNKTRNYGTITNCKPLIYGSVYGTKYVGGVSGYSR